MMDFFFGMALVILAIGLVFNLGGPSSQEAEKFANAMQQLLEEQVEQQKLILNKLDAVDAKLEQLNVNHSPE